LVEPNDKKFKSGGNNNKNVMHKLKQFSDKHSGERAFFIGNGPSLKKTPLNELSTETTVAVNRINKIYDKTEWRPDYYLYARPVLKPDDKIAVEKNVELDIQCFINSKHKSEIGEHPNVYYLNIDRLPIDPIRDTTNAHNPTTADIDDAQTESLLDYWSKDMSKKVYVYHSPYPTYQLLFYMGFAEIYLLGHDLGFDDILAHMIFIDGLNPAKYSGEKTQYIKEAYDTNTLLKSLVNGITLKLLQSRLGYFYNRFANENTEHHFTSDYTKNNISYKNRDAELRNAHSVARKIGSCIGVDIYNCTKESHLDTFEQIELNKIL
jgi:hypothetical protein